MEVWGGWAESAAACVGRVPRVMRVGRRRAWRAGQAVDGPATACDGSANYWVTIPGGTGGPGRPDQPGWGRRPGRRDRRAGAWAERMRAGQFAAMRVCVCVPRAPPARPPRPCSLSLSLSACLLLAVAVVAAAARAARARVNFMACFLLLLGEMGIGVCTTSIMTPRSTPPKNEKQNYNRAGGRHALTLDPAGGSPRHSLSLSH